MKFEIKQNDAGDKELYLNGVFQASWDGRVDDTKTIIPYALDEAYRMGEEAKQKEIRQALGL